MLRRRKERSFVLVRSHDDRKREMRMSVSDVFERKVIKERMRLVIT